MAVASDDGSDAEEIPYRKRDKAAAEQLKQDLVEAANGDDDEDMEEDEYVVERITNHKFTKKGGLTLLVKWQGYDDSESTWEPEENLENCPDQLEAYFGEIGGKPTANKKATSAGPEPKKRKVSEIAAAESSTPPLTSSKRGRKKAEDASVKAPTSESEYPKGSWEDLVLNIDTMELGEGGTIYVYLVWKSNKKTRHPASVVYAKCPQKCLQFYESHLQFSPPVKPNTTPAAAAPAANAPPQAPPAPVPNPPAKVSESSTVDEGYDDEQDEEEVNVKGVASAPAAQKVTSTA